jgi:hypothetical protein
MITATPVNSFTYETQVAAAPVAAVRERTAFDFSEVRQTRRQHRLAVAATWVAAVSTIVFAVAVILVR